MSTRSNFQEIRSDFISQWGILGNAWGINRTMAQIHALLMVSAKPVSTQEVMDELEISRGNANTNLRELVSWGLIKSKIFKGDRKEYFEAEKDVWKIFCIVTRERKKREIEPTTELLQSCSSFTPNKKNEEEVAFVNQIKELENFVSLASNFMEKVSKSEQNKIVPKVLKIL